MGPEMFMVPRISLRPRFPGGPVPADWTIHPWLPLNGPYTMQMEVLIDGKWQPQVWYGPTARSLGEGKLVVEPFQTELSPEGPTALRTRILYRRGNQKAPAVGILEVLVPEAK
jgi:hypothetical protein